MRLLQLVALALVTIILAVFVIRPILASRRQPLPADHARTLGTGATGQIALVDTTVTSPSSSAEPQALAMPSPTQGAAVLPQANDETVAGPDGTEEDPVSRLKAMIEARQPDTIEILRNWLEDEQVREKA
jgi:flagellar M-ring protein FliF